MSILSQQEIAAPNKEIQPQKELKASLEKKAAKDKYFTTKRITYIATLAAIALMFKMLGNFFPISETQKITFVYFAWMLSAIVLGPFGGAVVGFTSDVLGQFIVPTGGSINPFITLSNTLFPLIVGLFYKLPLKNKNLCILLGSLISTSVCTMGITAVTLYYLQGHNLSMTFFNYLFTFRIMQPFFVAANVVVLLTILPIIKRLKMFENLK